MNFNKVNSKDKQISLKPTPFNNKFYDIRTNDFMNEYTNKHLFTPQLGNSYRESYLD